jgi:hypothetical protein
MKKFIIGLLISLMCVFTVHAREQERPWTQLVSEGAVPQYSFVEKFGENPEIDTGSEPQNIWSYGGMYTYSTVADIDSIVCGNAADITEITIQGLGADGRLLEQTVTSAGLTVVPIPVPFLRVFRAFNSGTVTLLTHCYIFVDSTVTNGVPNDPTKVRAEIHIGINTGLSGGQTEMAQYTIPVGYVGYLYSGYTGISRGGNLAYAQFVVRLRSKDGVWRTAFRDASIGQGTSTSQYLYSVPLPMPAGQDLDIICTKVGTNDTGVFGGFTILLKKLY